MSAPHQKKTPAFYEFCALAGTPGTHIDPVEGALLVAQLEYPDLDRAVYRRQLETMRGEAAEFRRGDTLDRITGLNQLFFERWGFRGNREDYYDPRNSCLNDVLDRRLGIPITLSLVYIEIARGAALPLVGIGMPGHFLVGMADRSDLYLDAFNGGTLLTRADCAARLRELNPELAFRPEFLDPTGPRQILTRMLNNLLGIYAGASLYAKALGALEMIQCLEPDAPEWLRQRGLVQAQLKNYSQAIADLDRYLALVPDAPDRESLNRQLSLLHQLRSMVN